MSQTTPARSELELRDYVGVIRRRKVSILLVTFALLAITMVVTFMMTPVYEAEASVILEQPIATGLLNPNAASISAVTDAEVQTEAELMQSRPINRAIGEKLGYEPDVDVSTKEGSPAVLVTSRDPDPEVAAKNVNDFAETYVIVRQEAISRVLFQALADVESQVSNLDTEIAAARTRLLQIEFELRADPPPSAEKIRLLEAERSRLRAETAISEIADRQDGLRTKRDDLLTKAALRR